MRLVQLCSPELARLNSFQNLTNPINHWSKILSERCSGSIFFHLCEVVQTFQWESIFCSKISSGGGGGGGGGVLIYQKISSGGNQFGGSIFTVTGLLSQPQNLTNTRIPHVLVLISTSTQ